MNTPDWITAICSGGSFICDLALKMTEISLFKKHNVALKQDDTPINEVLLYGAENEEHTKQIGLNNLLCIYYVIVDASRSVDVCVPRLASRSLAQGLVSARRRRRVHVRVSIHYSDNSDNLQLLAQNDIEVKIIKPAVRLEHEFLLVDASERSGVAVAVMGSLDYETSRVNCNRDATVLTSETCVVTALKTEFDRVWHSAADMPFTKLDI